MERASRHSTLGENGFKTFTGMWGDQQYTFVERLNLSRPDSIEDIRSGIEAMASHYNTNRESQISNIIEYIDDFTNPKKGKHRAITGFNLEYDTQVINRYAQLHNTRALSENFQYADTMFGLRAYAAANNTTIAEIIKQYNPRISNERLGSLEAIMEAVTDSAGYSTNTAHNAFEDSFATLRVFQNNGLNIIDKALSVVNSLTEEPNSVNLKNSYVKINSKGNVRSKDMTDSYTYIILFNILF